MYNAGHSQELVDFLVKHAEEVGGWVMVDPLTGQPIPRLTNLTCDNLALDGTYCSVFEVRPIITFTKNVDGTRLKSIEWTKPRERVIWHLVSADKEDWMDRNFGYGERPDFKESVKFEVLQVLLDEMEQLKLNLISVHKFEDALTMQSALSILADNPRPCLSRGTDGVWHNCIHHTLYSLARKVETYRDKDGNPLPEVVKAMNLAKIYIRPGNPLFNYQFPPEGVYWSEMDYLIAWAGLHRHVNALMKKYRYTSRRAWSTAKNRLYKEHPTFKALEIERRYPGLPVEVREEVAKDAAHFLEFTGERVEVEDASYAMRLRYVKKSQGEGHPSIIAPSILHKCPASFGMMEGKRAQWILLHEIWGRSLTRTNPFPESWVRTGDDPKVCANHSAIGFSYRSRGAKVELTKCAHECDVCAQEELVYPVIGPKGIQLVVDTNALLSRDERIVEMAIELLATIDALRHRPPIAAEDDELLKEVIRRQYDFSLYEGDDDEGPDPYHKDPLKKRPKPTVQSLGLASNIKTPEQWIQVVDAAIERSYRKHNFVPAEKPRFKQVTVVKAKTKVEPTEGGPKGIKLYGWMCPAIVLVKKMFPEKGILTKTTPYDPTKVKVIPCGMPTKQNGVMTDPNYG